MKSENLYKKNGVKILIGIIIILAFTFAIIKSNNSKILETYSSLKLAYATADDIKTIDLTTPDKLEYYQGEELDLTGGYLDITYTDGAVARMPLDSSDITITGFDSSITGECEITVTYLGLTTSFLVRIIATTGSSISLQDIEVLSAPTQTEYYIGEEINLSGGVLNLIYFVDSSRDGQYTLTVIASMSSYAVVVDFDTSNYGQKDVTLCLTDGSDVYTVLTYTITVVEYKKGDLDKDHDVDAVDAALALDIYKYGGQTEEDIEIGDMNDDGAIDAIDAALILDVYKYGE